MDDFGDEKEPSEEELHEDMEPKSLMVTLRYGKGRSPSVQHTPVPTTHPVVVIPISSQPAHLTLIPQQSTHVVSKPIIPTASTSNGYPSPSSTGNSINGYPQQAPSRSAAPPSNVLPPLYNTAPTKQTQLPFQPSPQHTLKPAAPAQPQAFPNPQHYLYQPPPPPQQPQKQPPS
jgi:hypothetical protein